MKIIKTANYMELESSRQVNNVCNSCKKTFKAKETDFSPRCPHCGSRDSRATTALEDHSMRLKNYL